MRSKAELNGILFIALLASAACGSAGAEDAAPAAAPAPAVAPESAPPTPVASPDRSAEVARTLEGLRSPVVDERVAACKSLSFSGIDDEAVYDLIERNVLAGFAKIPKKGGYADREVEQETGWCAKALAYAGREKYRPTLEKLAASKGRIADHAENTLPRIAEFARWNQIINSTADHKPGESWETTRARNMVKANDPPLQREGLKAIKELTEDPTPLHDLVEANLLAAHAKDLVRGSEEEDIAAWYCRSLAASRNLKYRETLRRVAVKTRSDKLRTYAKKALGDLAAQ